MSFFDDALSDAVPSGIGTPIAIAAGALLLHHFFGGSSPAPAPPAATVDALGRLDVELQRVQAAQKTTVEAFARHIDADINMVRAEMAEIDALIRGIHASRVWSLKEKLGAVRRRLLARGR